MPGAHATDVSRPSATAPSCALPCRARRHTAAPRLAISERAAWHIPISVVPLCIALSRAASTCNAKNLLSGVAGVKTCRRRHRSTAFLAFILYYAMPKMTNGVAAGKLFRTNDATQVTLVLPAFCTRAAAVWFPPFYTWMPRHAVTCLRRIALNILYKTRLSSARASLSLVNNLHIAPLITNNAAFLSFRDNSHRFAEGAANSARMRFARLS